MRDMKMATDDQSDLATVVEEIRAEQFPDLPADLVREILNAEGAFVEDRTTAVKRITELIDVHVASKTG
jgi:hypothetical protein